MTSPNGILWKRRKKRPCGAFGAFGQEPFARDKGQAAFKSCYIYNMWLLCCVSFLFLLFVVVVFCVFPFSFGDGGLDNKSMVCWYLQVVRTDFVHPQ